MVVFLKLCYIKDPSLNWHKWHHRPCYENRCFKVHTGGEGWRVLGVCCQYELLHVEWVTGCQTTSTNTELQEEEEDKKALRQEPLKTATALVCVCVENFLLTNTEKKTTILLLFFFFFLLPAFTQRSLECVFLCINLIFHFWLTLGLVQNRPHRLTVENTCGWIQTCFNFDAKYKKQ